MICVIGTLFIYVGLIELSIVFLLILIHLFEIVTCLCLPGWHLRYCNLEVDIIPSKLIQKLEIKVELVEFSFNVFYCKQLHLNFCFSNMCHSLFAQTFFACVVCLLRA